MSMYIRATQDVKLFVEDLNPAGDKTILFVHGWPGNHRLFEYQFDVLPSYGYRCIGIDYRGFGASDKPWRGYDYNTLADDLKYVIEALRLERITLLGHSTGGAICVRYMARHQGFGVSKLVLAAAAAPSLIQRPYFPHGLPRQDVQNIIRNTYSDRPQMLRDFGGMIFYKPVTQAFSDWIFSLGLEASGWATAKVAETWLGEEALFEDLKRITAPTLILQGVHDKVVLPPLSEAQHRSIKNSILVPLEESGHFSFCDQKERFSREVMRFAQG